MNIRNIMTKAMLEFDNRSLVEQMNKMVHIGGLTQIKKEKRK